ncbi:MAG: TatD family deoxyribonuclease [Acidobacteria bacterium]|nr:TatD family deoxyribonuclease [Acidobacteriota bacterium]
MIDSHCHLDDGRFNSDREAVIGRALEAGVEAMVTIGTGDGPPDLEAAIRIADRHPEVWATVGVHPHDAAKSADGTMARIEELARHPKVVAIGEIGLDYHYDFSPRDRQKAVFGEQLDIANRLGLPIVIHTREAWDDTLAIIEALWSPAAGGIMHCFSGGPQEAARCVAMGFHISFAGIVTYPKAVEIQHAAAGVPLDRLLIETDAPYLAPVPHRGKRNEPAFVSHTAEWVAALRGLAVETVARTTAENWRRLCAGARSG